ncbi:MAG: glycoside hydrolase family 30 beta sandwich domain-containing protein [Ginsengibacter sp.]
MLPRKKLIVIIICPLIVIAFACSTKKPGTSTNPVSASLTGNNEVDFWLTKSDQSVLLQKQSTALSFDTANNANPFIDVDSTQVFQSIDGFGYSLTGGSAYVINRLSTTDKTNLLKELFGNDNNSIGVSYLRIGIGASDLNASVFSYDDLPAGQTDINLAHFTLDSDRADILPLLKEILQLNPAIKILGSPWSSPVWMKDSGNSKGGSLQTQYYEAYARYFVKYIQQMKAEGIIIDAITPQNEPLNPGNNPSMLMLATQQADFIKNNLGPAFRAAGITTKIVTYDHNCDHPDYPLTVLNDVAARGFVNGSAFHLYNGDISALSQVHNAYPDKQVYFTEQWTGANESFDDNLKWHLKNVIIGSMRNWSRVALEWNLASDPSYNPHTPGGCTECKGALTIGTSITRNVAYYIIAHASKFVPAGSVRIGSNVTGSLYNVAFKTPAGKKVLIVENDGITATSFNIRFNAKWVTTILPAGGVGTYVW